MLWVGVHVLEPGDPAAVAKHAKPGDHPPGEERPEPRAKALRLHLAHRQQPEPVEPFPALWLTVGMHGFLQVQGSSQSGPLSSMRNWATPFGCGAGVVAAAVSTALRSASRPAASSASSPASPLVPSTPMARCSAAGNSRANALVQEETIPAAGGRSSSRKLPQWNVGLAGVRMTW